MICDVIQVFLSLQKLSDNIQDYSHNGTTPAVQMKWVLCHVIYLNSWLQREEILCCGRKDQVLEGGIRQTSLLLANIKCFICDVITNCLLIGWRRNRTMNPRELIFPWQWSDSSVMLYLYIADDKGETFNPVAGVIQYLMEAFTKRHCC